MTAVRRRLALVGYLFLAAGVVAAFYFSWESDNEREEDRAEVEEAREHERVVARYTICEQIETFKKAERDEAIAARKRLRENLRLLGRPFTPSIRAAANKAKFDALRRHAPREEGCVQFALNPAEDVNGALPRELRRHAHPAVRDGP